MRHNQGILFKIERHSTEKAYTSASFKGARLWNELPPHIRQEDRKAQFKAQIKEFYKNKFILENN